MLEGSSRLSLPKSTLERWRSVSKRGNLDKIGKDQRSLTEIESELAEVKQDILKKRPRTLPVSRYQVCGDQGVVIGIFCCAECWM